MECELQEALKKIETIEFDPTDTLELEDTFLVLSHWEIRLKNYDIILKDGFILNKEYDPFQYSKTLSCVIFKDECIYSNRKFYAILEDLLGISREKIKTIECIFTSEEIKNDKNYIWRV